MVPGCQDLRTQFTRKFDEGSEALCWGVRVLPMLALLNLGFLSSSSLTGWSFFAFSTESIIKVLLVCAGSESVSFDSSLWVSMITFDLSIPAGTAAFFRLSYSKAFLLKTYPPDQETGFLVRFCVLWRCFHEKPGFWLRASPKRSLILNRAVMLERSPLEDGYFSNYDIKPFLEW